MVYYRRPQLVSWLLQSINFIISKQRSMAKLSHLISVLISLSVFLSMITLTVQSNGGSTHQSQALHLEKYQLNLTKFKKYIPEQLRALKSTACETSESQSLQQQKLRAQLSSLSNNLAICESLLQNRGNEVIPASCSVLEDQIKQKRSQLSRLQDTNSNLSLQVTELQANKSILLSQNYALIKELNTSQQELQKAKNKANQQCENCQASGSSQADIQQLRGDLTTCHAKVESYSIQVVEMEQNIRNQGLDQLNLQLDKWAADLRRQFSTIVREVNATLQANKISKLDFTEILNTLKHIEHLHEGRSFTTFKETSEAYRGAMRDLSSQLIKLTSSAASIHSQELAEVKLSKKEVAKKFDEVLQKLKECNQMLSPKRN